MTLLVCAGLALALGAGMVASGHAPGGLALVGGLLLGSLNGHLARWSLGADLDFRASSLGRLGLLSALAVALGALVGGDQIILALLGVALSQLVLAASAGFSLVRG